MYDEDLDCIIAYQRCFSGRAYVYDLLGELAAIEAQRDVPPAPDFPLLVIGSLWSPGMRCMARTGYDAIGIAMDDATISGLRQRFHALSRRTLSFSPAALASMQDAARFVPIHLLRIALLLGERLTDATAPGVYRYKAPILRRFVRQSLELVLHEQDSMVIAFHCGPPDNHVPARY